MGFVRKTISAVDKTADFIAKDRSKPVDRGAVSRKICYGGCGGRGKKLYAGYGHCGSGTCRQVITHRILN